MIITGYCPTLDKDHSIEVDYINTSTLQGRSYIKGLFTCEVVSFGGDCSYVKDCPLYKQAPEER